MGILSRLNKIANKTAKTSELPGGIHEDIELVDFRKDVQSNSNYKRYLLLKFKQMKDGKAVGEYTHSFMELVPSSQYLSSKVETLLVQTHSLAVALYGDDWVNHYDPFQGLLESPQEAKKLNVDSKIERRAFTKDLEQNVKDQVEKFVNNYLENNPNKKFRLKLVYNDKGYINIPNYKFIENMEDDTTMILSDKDKMLINKFKK